MNKQIIVGGLVGGVLSFVVGYLVWGLLLMDFYTANTNQCAALATEDMVWWSLIAFNLFWGFTLAFVLNWAGSVSFADGMVKGAILGILISLTVDLSMYSFSTMFTGGLSVIAVDVAVNAVFTGVIGGIIAVAMSKVS